jgi:hypothetical protein
MSPRTAAFAALFALLASPALGQGQPPPAANNPADWSACRAAVREAERGTQLPPNLLASIARVESGRRNPETGEFGPWPWTINAEGQGRFFRTKAEAIAEVRALQARGVRSMDVGCMQINLMFHPAAFANLDEAFDPLTNARYAVRFLTELNSTRNNWTQSAANYHSNTAEFATAYQRRVQAAMPEEARLAATTQRDERHNAWQSARAEGRFVPGGAFLLGAPGGATLSNAPPVATRGMTGRDLDSYRNLPVMPGRMGVSGGPRRM